MHEIVHRPARLFERRTNVVTMALVEVDVLDVQTPQARIDLRADVFARETAIVGTVAHREEHLRREHDRIAREILDRAADDFFGAAARVDVRGIEERHAQFVRAPHARARRRFFHAAAVGEPRSESHRGNLHAPLPDVPILHARRFLRDGRSASYAAIARRSADARTHRFERDEAVTKAQRDQHPIPGQSRRGAAALPPQAVVGRFVLFASRPTQDALQVRVGCDHAMDDSIAVARLYRAAGPPQRCPFGPPLPPADSLLVIEHMFDYHGLPCPPRGYAELHAWSNFTLPRGGLAPRGAGRRRPRAGPGRPRADRPRRPLRCRSLRESRQDRKLPAICGAELTLETPDPDRSAPAAPRDRRARCRRIPRGWSSWSRTHAGYANLCELISLAQLRGRKRDARARLDDLDGRTDGLIALSGGRNGLVENALLARDDDGARRDRRAAARSLSRPLLSRAAAPYAPRRRRARAGAGRGSRRELDVPYVATNGVAYVDREDARLCDVLTCVKYKTTLHSAGTLLRPNVEFVPQNARSDGARCSHAYPLAIAQHARDRRALHVSSREAERPIPALPIPPEEPSHAVLSAHARLRGARKRYGSPFGIRRSSASSSTNSASSRGWISPATF